jgi:simple sugar transport system ATP-binding protein
MLLTDPSSAQQPGLVPELLRLEGISKAYPGVVALDRVDFGLRAGEIHALVGENGAGKSTLMSVLYGLVRQDEGTVMVYGKPVSVPSPRHARELGIGLVQQHFALIPTLSAAQNLVLALRGTDRARSVAAARALLIELGARYGLSVNPDVPVERLPISQQQRAEVLKALAADVRVLALDEPNALLTPAEWEQLAAVLRKLADAGVAVLLISHKLNDVMAIADRVTVLRRGRVVATTVASETDADKLGALMVGAVALPVLREVETAAPADAEIRLEVSGLSVAGPGRPAVDAFSLSLRRGEIVGLAGVEGSGQVEVTEVLAGTRKGSGGRIVHNGIDVTETGVLARQRAGFGYVPADRLAAGMIADLSVAENMLLPVMTRRPFSRAGLLSPRRMRERGRELIEEFDVRVPGPDVRAGDLSGGNQQKVVLARELSRRPNVLICCYATRGLDFAAAAAVRTRVIEASSRGAAVLYASVDLDEILDIADRIIVMHGGEIVGELARGEADAETLGALMGGRRAA